MLIQTALTWQKRWLRSRITVMYPNPNVVADKTLYSWTPAGDKLTTLLTSPPMVNFEEQNGYRTPNDNGSFVSYMAAKGITVPTLSGAVPQFVHLPTELSLCKLITSVVPGPPACS